LDKAIARPGFLDRVPSRCENLNLLQLAEGSAACTSAGASPSCLGQGQVEVEAGCVPVLVAPQDRAPCRERHPREESMNVRPLADRILVRRIEEQETKRGGIIIPDTAKEKPQEGEVVAVGPGRMTEEGKRIAMDVKKGDRVLIGKYSGTDVKIDGTEYVILREDDVLGVLAERK
jgi:chaperonin GroES